MKHSRTLTIVALSLGALAIVIWLAFLSIQSGRKRVALEFQRCGIEGDLREQLSNINSNKFILAVVGDGVKDPTLAKTRPYSSNYAQGWDLYEGIAHAANKLPFTDISQFVELIYVDDGGDKRCAELISEEISKSPKVIGVIGHASTGTTKIALSNYKKANIPTIIPIATNPNLTIGCTNCFRLPSNDAVQAKVISDYAVNVLKGQNIYLVWDESESAKEYSDFLQSEVVNLIGSKLKFRQPITFRPMNYEYLLKSISYNNTDVLIFCGYGSMAREFLNGLRLEYVGKENLLAKPKVILSDGSRIADIKEVSSIFGFEAYLSFPSDKLSTNGQFADFVPETPPHEQEKMKFEESYEVFGYDALALFSLAFKRMTLRGEISRKLLNESLAEDNPAGSNLCYSYRFKGGENVEPRYFIYSVGSDSVERQYNSTYLSNIFTDKASAELIGRYDGIQTDDKVLRERLVGKLARDRAAKALIILSDDAQTHEASQQALQLLKYLVNDHKVDPGRIVFALGVGLKAQTQVWVIPLGAPGPPLSGNFSTVKGEDLVKSNKNSFKSE